MTTYSNIQDRGISFEEAKAVIARKDRQSWFPSLHPTGGYRIVSGRDGREVAACANGDDRDFLIATIKLHEPMRAALETFSRGIRDMRDRGVIVEHIDDLWLNKTLEEADRVLAITNK